MYTSFLLLYNHSPDNTMIIERIYISYSIPLLESVAGIPPRASCSAPLARGDILVREFRVNSRSITISAKTRDIFLSSRAERETRKRGEGASERKRERCRVSIISYSREEADTLLGEVSIGSARGQRSGKRLSLRHCRTILPGPWLG